MRLLLAQPHEPSVIGMFATASSLSRAVPKPVALEPQTNRRVAILTPVLDDWACFAALLRDISAQYAGSDVEFHICAVDDGSATAFDPAAFTVPAAGCIAGVEIIRLALNLGHQRAIAVGLCALAERSDIDAVIVIDGDGEDRPSDIAALLAAGREHPGDVVIARREKRSESAAFRLWYGLYKFSFHLLTGHSHNFGNFSLLPIAAVRRLVHMPELWNNLPASIMRSRLRRVAIPTVRGKRYEGRSRMNLVGLIVHGLSALSVHIDTIFVRVLLSAGVVALAAICGIVAVAVVRFTTDLAIPGWATSAAGLLVLVLLQTGVIVVASTLMMLAGRSTRPLIPIADARQFIAHRESHYLRQPAKSRVGA